MSTKAEITEMQELMEKAATMADQELQDDLLELSDMADRRRPDPVLEADYKNLRNKLVPLLKASGPKYYLDTKGFKHYASVVQPEPVKVSLEKLEAMYTRGELDLDVLDLVAPRRSNTEAFRLACLQGRFTDAQVLDAVETTAGTAHVRFSQPTLG
jgi:hypothetical protein